MQHVSYPFLCHDSQGAILVHGTAGSVTVEHFLGDVAALAARLPEAPYVINLCADRYRFTVGFAAALSRRQVTLLPSSEAAASLDALARQYDGAYFLHDTGFVAAPDLTATAFPNDLAGDTGPVPSFPADQVAAILFTSGSTGAPVPHPRSWGALVSSTRAAARALGVADLTNATLLGTVPHQHSYGIESIVMLALQHGFAFHGTRSLLPADILGELAAITGPRILITTPVHLRSLVAHEGALPLVHCIVSATAPLATELARQAEQRFDAPLYEIYGCSEVGQIAARRTVKTEEWSCIDGIALVARDGDVWASGPAAAIAAPLNDIIELNGPKRFLLRGRKQDMINIAGKRSSLAYLNHRLNAIDGVADGVFVLPDGDGTTRLTAYVVAPGMTSRQILAALRREIDPAFLPRPLYFVDALPRNSLGKISRHAMEQLNLETIER
ncbi:MAG: beta-hydroxyacyl-ACP dehydratase [Rhodospirillales bacterium]|nr:beta-hydroxyacyl-ACP dehydratase [Rhodospirillales bacterium]